MAVWEGQELATLAGLYLQNERSFIVRRLVLLFLEGKITAREAIERIRQSEGIQDQDPELKR